MFQVKLRHIDASPSWNIFKKAIFVPFKGSLSRSFLEKLNFNLSQTIKSNKWKNCNNFKDKAYQDGKSAIADDVCEIGWGHLLSEAKASKPPNNKFNNNIPKTGLDYVHSYGFNLI